MFKDKVFKYYFKNGISTTMNRSSSLRTPTFSIKQAIAELTAMAMFVYIGTVIIIQYIMHNI